MELEAKFKQELAKFQSQAQKLAVKNSQNTKPKQFNKTRIKRLYKELIRRSKIPGRFKEKSFDDIDVSAFKGLKDKLSYIKDFAAKYPNLDYPFIYLVGPPGNGKSHVATSALKKIAWNQAKEIEKELKDYVPPSVPDNQIFSLYINWRITIKKMRSSYRDWRSDFSALEMIEKMQKAKALVIDDLFARSRLSLADLDDIFEIIDYRLQNNKVTIITSNKHPGKYLTSLQPEDLRDYQYNKISEEELDLIADRIASRILEGCGRKKIEFTGPNQRVN